MPDNNHANLADEVPSRSEAELAAIAYWSAVGKLETHFAPQKVEVRTYNGPYQCKVKVGRKFLGWIMVQDVLDDKWEFKPSKPNTWKQR
jgi:hypothetical protein